MPTLFDPLKAGALTLPNRILMAPLTRSRATADARIPTDLQADYYRQRASAGLIFTEATSVTPRGVGYAATPGIWSGRTDAKAGSGASPQLAAHWHGQAHRVAALACRTHFPSRSSLTANCRRSSQCGGEAQGNVSLTFAVRPNSSPRARRAFQKSPRVIAEFRKGAQNAESARLKLFDAVRIHGANNGCLLDQFCRRIHQPPQRQNMAAEIENRARLMLREVTAMHVAEVWGADPRRAHLAPRIRTSPRPACRRPVSRLGTFTYIARELGKHRLAWTASRARMEGRHRPA